MINNIINNIANELKVLADNAISNDAIINVLNAKFTHLFSFKGITFNSINNLKKAYPLAYYGLNFVGSGGDKNKTLSEINYTLLPFFKDEYIKINEKYKEQKLIEFKKDNEFKLLTPTEIKKQQIKEEYIINNLSRLKHIINKTTPAKLYKNAEVIKIMKYGSIFIQNTEFAQLFETAMSNQLTSEKEILDLLFDFFDGELNIPDTVSTDRDIMEGIAFSLIFMSDFTLILNNSKLNKAFKSWLARGGARRIFIFINKEENYFKNPVQFSNFEDRNTAYSLLENYNKILKTKFDNIPVGNNYIFSSSANEVIQNWKIECNETILNLCKNIDFLDLDLDILTKDLKGSPWKIIKLAVTYHILNSNEHSSLIQPESVKQAIEYYKKSYKSLESLLNKKPNSDIDNCFNFFQKNINVWQPKMILRAQNFTDSQKFTDWIKNNINYIREMAQKKGYGFVEKPLGSIGSQYVLYDPQRYKFESTVTDGCSIEKGELIDLGYIPKLVRIEEL